MTLQMVPHTPVAASLTSTPSLRHGVAVAAVPQSSSFTGPAAAASAAQQTGVCAALVAGAALAGCRELRRRRHGELCRCGRCQRRGQLVQLAATGLMERESTEALAPTQWGQVPVTSNSIAPIPLPFGDVALDNAMMGYRNFVPRLYNWCKQLGMTKGRIMPSIGFCADENQGYPTIIITKHFGAYPFNHGYLGGILALDRHGPHAAHGEDMVIIHAPHVGYDPLSKKYGIYRRMQVSPDGKQVSTCCGAMAGTLAPYKNEYNTLLGRIRVRVDDGDVLVSLSNRVLPIDQATDPLTDGIFLNFDLMLEPGALDKPALQQSTSEVFRARPEFAKKVYAALAEEDASAKTLPESEGVKGLPGTGASRKWRSLSEPGLKKLLEPEMFYFKRSGLDGEAKRLERVLVPHMPFLLTAPYEAELSAAIVIGQSEFDRAVASVSSEPSYKGKNLVLVSGLNIDVSPDPDMEQNFPSTTFLPWAAYVQLKDGSSRVLEQGELVEALMSVPAENPDAIDIEVGITELFSRARKPVTIFDCNTETKREPTVL